MSEWELQENGWYSLSAVGKFVQRELWINKSQELFKVIYRVSNHKLSDDPAKDGYLQLRDLFHTLNRDKTYQVEGFEDFKYLSSEFVLEN